jgi:hypothetical protein
VLLRGYGAADLYFAHPRRATLHRVPLPAAWRGADDGKAVRLEFASNTRPALELNEPVPDWRGYDSLLLDVTNPGKQALAAKPT